MQAWVQCETCGYREQERPSGWYPLQHHTSWPSLQFSLRTDTRSTEDGTHTKPLFQCAAYLFPTKGNRRGKNILWSSFYFKIGISSLFSLTWVGCMVEWSHSLKQSKSWERSTETALSLFTKLNLNTHPTLLPTGTWLKRSWYANRAKKEDIHWVLNWLNFHF